MAKKTGKTRRGRSAAKTRKIPYQETSRSASIAVGDGTRKPVRIANAWRITAMAAMTLWQHRRLFAGITLVYGLLNLILVRGLASSTDVSGLKHTLDQLFIGHFGSLFSGLAVFAVLVGSAGNGSSQTAGAYQVFLALITSLALIWALRQVLAGARLRIRDAYYQGMYPLVPFMLVLLIVSLQLVPLALGTAVYATVIANGIAVHFIEKALWFFIFVLSVAISFYFISSSLFALYIVTLPDMTPIKALRTARKLVSGRRLSVFRKIIWLPIVLLIVAVVIVVPIIVLLTPLAQWIFFILTMFSLAAIHAYMYTLYRELINE